MDEMKVENRYKPNDRDYVYLVKATINEGNNKGDTFTFKIPAKDLKQALKRARETASSFADIGKDFIKVDVKQTSF